MKTKNTFLDISIFISGFFPVVGAFVFAETMAQSYDLGLYGFYVFIISLSRVIIALSTAPTHEQGLKSYRSGEQPTYIFELSTITPTVLIGFIIFINVSGQFDLTVLCVLLCIGFYLTSVFDELSTINHKRYLFVFRKVSSFMVIIGTCLFISSYNPSHPIKVILMVTVIEALIFTLIMYRSLQDEITISFKFLALQKSIQNKQGAGLYLNKLTKAASQNIDTLLIGVLFSHELLTKYDLLKKISVPILMSTNSFFMVFNIKVFEDKAFNIDLLYRTILQLTVLVSGAAIIYYVGVIYGLQFVELKIKDIIIDHTFELFFIISAFTLRAILWWPRFITIYINAWLSISSTILTTAIMAIGLTITSMWKDLYLIVIVYFFAYFIAFIFWFINLYKLKNNPIT